MTSQIMMNLRIILKLSSISTIHLFLPIQMLIHSFVDIGEEVKIDVDIVLVSILANGENTSHSSEIQLFGWKLLIFDTSIKTVLHVLLLKNFVHSIKVC